MFYFTKDIHANINAIINAEGQVLARYEYTAWGEHICKDADGTIIYDSKTGVVAGFENHIGNINPIKYRSYYWDDSVKLYYLQTRWYDPEVGRWISPDKIEILDVAKNYINGLNLYAYCFNNWVNMVDDTGMWPRWLRSVASWVGGAVNTVLNSQVAGWITVAATAIAGIGLMVGGVLVTALNPQLGATLFGAGVGTLAGIVGSLITQGSSINPWQAVRSGLIGAAIGAAIGFLGFHFAQLGAQFGSQLGFNISKVTHLSSGATISKVFGVTSNTLVRLGGALGGIAGGAFGGFLVNWVADESLGDLRENDKATNFVLRRIRDMFKWLRR